MSQYEFDDQPYVVIEKETGSAASLLLGFAIGAGIALLFAPRAGIETRRELTRGARRVQRRAQDVVGEVTGTVSDGFHQARQHVEEHIDAARQAVELKREQVARAVEAGRVAANQAREELERRIAETKAAYQSAGSAPGALRAGRSPVVNDGDDDSGV
jgi:gas vesicle protein